MKKKINLPSIFIPKKAVWQTDLLKGMVDIHSHYLPGVDDGMRTIDESVRALVEMQEQGMSRIYLSPHIMAELKSNTPAFLREQFSKLIQKKPDGLELRLAGEYMLDASFYTQLKEDLLTLSNKNVLIEMSYMSPSPKLESTIYDLLVRGYSPILAHPERYLFMEQKDYIHLKEKQCRYQLNLLSLSGLYGKRAYEVGWYLLQQDLYDFVGTDIHNLRIFKEAMTRLRINTTEKKLIRRVIEQNEDLW